MKKEEQKQQAEQAVQSADIIATLATLSRGRFMVDCGRKLHELVEAINETRTKGTLTIKLEVRPGTVNKEGRVDQLEIVPEVKIAKPEQGHGKSLFFLTEDLSLTRDDPSQLGMDFEKEEGE